MKQHITIEQFKEIGVKMQGDIMSYTDKKGDGVLYYKECAERITIGKMIEILKDMCIIQHKTFKIVHDISKSSKDMFYVDLSNCMDGNITWHKKELCDALWEAVKEAQHEI